MFHKHKCRRCFLLFAADNLAVSTAVDIYSFGICALEVSAIPPRALAAQTLHLRCSFLALGNREKSNTMLKGADLLRSKKKDEVFASFVSARCTAAAEQFLRDSRLLESTERPALGVWIFAVKYEQLRSIELPQGGFTPGASCVAFHASVNGVLWTEVAPWLGDCRNSPPTHVLCHVKRNLSESNDQYSLMEEGGFEILGVRTTVEKCELDTRSWCLRVGRTCKK